MAFSKSWFFKLLLNYNQSNIIIIIIINYLIRKIWSSLATVAILWIRAWNRCHIG